MLQQGSWAPCTSDQAPIQPRVCCRAPASADAVTNTLHGCAGGTQGDRLLSVGLSSVSGPQGSFRRSVDGLAGIAGMSPLRRRPLQMATSKPHHPQPQPLTVTTTTTTTSRSAHRPAAPDPHKIPELGAHITRRPPWPGSRSLAASSSCWRNPQPGPAETASAPNPA